MSVVRVLRLVLESIMNLQLVLVRRIVLVVRVLHLVQYHNINRQHVQDLLIVSVVRVLLVQ